MVATLNDSGTNLVKNRISFKGPRSAFRFQQPLQTSSRNSLTVDSNINDSQGRFLIIDLKILNI